MLSCDCSCALCTFVRPVIRLLPCAFVRAGRVVPCEGAQGNEFWSGRVREAVSKMLSCDRPCALCTFVRPDRRLLLCAFVRAGQVVPCEGAQGNAFGSGRVREAVSKMLSCDRPCA